MLLSSVDHKHYLHSQTYIYINIKHISDDIDCIIHSPANQSDRLKVHDIKSIVHAIDAEHAKIIAKFQTHNNNSQILSVRTIEEKNNNIYI